MFSLILLLTLGCSAVQGLSQSFFHDASDSWDIDVEPNPNSTGNILFESVNSLLQSWPNRRYRNGHTIVPGIVPTGTFLYHGRADSQLPATPEWVSLDPELSNLYCGLLGTLETGCWHLTLVAVRPLKVLYFDGYSALKLPQGTLDSQDVVSWGKIVPEWTVHEYQRIQKLCEWGKPFGLDGFVRLHTLFEIMLCDFQAGVQKHSLLNLELPQQFPLEPPPSTIDTMFSRNNGSKTVPSIPPVPTRHIPFNSFGMHELKAVVRHDRYPGESRVQLDLSRLISFYDTGLVPSLVALRFGQSRLQHRLLGISSADIDAVRKRLEEELSAEKWSLNAYSFPGIDWRTLFRNVVESYSDQLELIRHLLNSTSSTRSDQSLSVTVFQQVQGILQPYNIRLAKPSISSVTGYSLDRSWASPVYQLCSNSVAHQISSTETFTPSERLMLDAVQVTNREICRVVTRIWASGVVNGLDKHRVPNARVKQQPAGVLLKQWKEEIDALMAWLDWSIWLKCKPACTLEEICYLPIYPYTFPTETEEWNNPQPECIPKYFEDIVASNHVH